MICVFMISGESMLMDEDAACAPGVIRLLVKTNRGKCTKNDIPTTPLHKFLQKISAKKLTKALSENLVN